MVCGGAGGLPSEVSGLFIASRKSRPTRFLSVVDLSILISVRFNGLLGLHYGHVVCGGNQIHWSRVESVREKTS